VSFEYFYNPGKTAPFTAGDTAWSRVAALDIVGEFAKSDYRVGIYLHRASAGSLYRDDDHWVVFLYRGRKTEP
jgi:hypothetical protein